MIGLRFDLTVGLSRFVSQRRELKMPANSHPLAGYGGMMNLSSADTDTFTNGT